MQTIQQQRAEYALSRVQQCVEELSEKEQKEYKSYASNLPAIIHTNGLGQTAAFYKSRARNEIAYEKLYDLLSNWLIGQNQPYSGHSDLLMGITRSDMQTYQLAQAEAQAIMDWVKKFAKAFMGGED